MKHLEKVAPIMLKLYFSDNRGEPESRANGRAAERIFTRFSANFAGKHEDSVENEWFTTGFGG